jgi:serine/threonine-protein phosphatase with EF-hand domain
MSSSASRKNSGTSDSSNSFYADKAAETIQRNFRGYKDRLKVREKAAFNIAQLIEYAEEQDHLNLNKFFVRWIQLIKKKSHQEVNQYVSASINDDLSHVTESEIKIESEYDGLHLSSTFNETDFKSLLNSFKNKEILHTRYVVMILNQALDKLSSLPNINELNCLDEQENTNPDYKVNVVGDLHGQFIDLFTIFDLNGLPSASNVYLFNGDFVDRGKQQCEVFLTLLYALVLYDGKYVNLNRGNHEDYGCSVRFGFKEEIMTKYCLYSKLIMKKCAQIFAHLPLASLIFQQSNKDNNVNKILVVHGGISVDTDLDLIRNLNRFNMTSVDGTNCSNDDDIQQKERAQLQDLLWSDPQAGSGCVFNKQRHIAKQFGPDVTEYVLSRYGISLLIRSHECKNEGYEFHHNNKCITIFSASNYCGGINKGSICVIRPRQKLEIKQFIAQGSGEIDKHKVELFEQKAIRGLKRLLYANRHLIREEFKRIDSKNTGYMTLSDWANALTRSMGMDKIPWLKYKDKLVEYNLKKGLVKYETSFDNCDVLYTFSTEHKDINDALARYKETLVALFNLIDDNHSGTINLQEFANACKIIFLDQNEAISDEAIKSMIEAMDTNKDGKIDLAEFTQAFIIYT